MLSRDLLVEGCVWEGTELGKGQSGCRAKGPGEGLLLLSTPGGGQIGPCLASTMEPGQPLEWVWGSSQMEMGVWKDSGRDRI